MTSTAWRNWSLPVVIVTLSGLLQFGMPAALEWLRFQPDMIREGQIWRLLTAHLVHLSWGHYLMNGLALLAICGLFAPLTPGRLAWWMLASACAVAFGLLWFDPKLGWYIGLSGMLHGLLVAASLEDLLARRPVGIAILAAVALKLTWEQAYGPMPGSEAAAGGQIIVNAHLYGAVGGVAAVAGRSLVSYGLRRWREARC